MANKLNIGFVICLCCFRETIMAISTCESSAKEQGYETVNFCSDSSLASNDTIVLDGFSTNGTRGVCTCMVQMIFTDGKDEDYGVKISDLSTSFHINPGCGTSLNYQTAKGNTSLECGGAFDIYSKREDRFTVTLNKTLPPYNSDYCIKIQLDYSGNLTLSCFSPNSSVTLPVRVTTIETTDAPLPAPPFTGTATSSTQSDKTIQTSYLTTEGLNPTNQTTETRGNLPFEIILPAAVGGAVVIIVLGIIIVCCTRRKSGKRQRAKNRNNFESGVNTNQSSYQQYNECAHELSPYSLEHGDDYGMQYNTLYTGHNTIKKNDTNNPNNGSDVVQSESTGDVYAVPNKGRNKKCVPNIDNVEETVCDVPKHISNITPTENKEADEAPVSKNNYLYAVPNKKKLSKTEYINTSFDT